VTYLADEGSWARRARGSRPPSDVSPYFHSSQLHPATVSAVYQGIRRSLKQFRIKRKRTITLPCSHEKPPSTTMTSTDPELATKAPESDAQEDAPAEPTAAADAAAAPTAAAAPAQESASQPKMCDDCVTDRPTRSSSSPSREKPLPTARELTLGCHQPAAKARQERSES
jgi:hypothetical protein